MQLLNMFLTYVLLFVIMVVVGGIAIALGITLRKNKNAKEATTTVETTEE